MCNNFKTMKDLNSYHHFIGVLSTIVTGSICKKRRYDRIVAVLHHTAHWSGPCAGKKHAQLQLQAYALVFNIVHLMSDCIHVLQQTLHIWYTQTEVLLSKAIESLVNQDVCWFPFLWGGSQLQLPNSPFNHAFLILQKRDELERVWTASSKLFVYEVMIALTGSQMLVVRSLWPQQFHTWRLNVAFGPMYVFAT